MQRLLLRAIHWYQRAAEGRPSPCRFFPSCSEYAREALEVHGAGRGTWLTVRRLSRCRPFGPSGFDPVPEPLDCSRHVDHAHHARHVDHAGDVVTGTEPDSPLSPAPTGASANVKVS
jgi:putative membrane protein insertion efficiency factor